MVGEEYCDYLYVNNRPLMWATPKELHGQYEVSQKARGDVLCAGYGLGIIQEYLLNNPKVKSLLTVEKYKAVVEVCKNKYGKVHGSVFIVDIYDYLDEKWIPFDGALDGLSIAPFTIIKFDTIIGDIWSGSIMADVAGYKKFRKAAKKHLKPGGQILMGPRDNI